RVVGRHRPPLEGEGVMGPLLDRLTYAPEDEGLVLALVGDAVLVESAARAIALAPRAEGRALVALDGTVVYPDGRISGGSGDAIAQELVEEQREMRELRDVCADLAGKVEVEVAEHQRVRERLAEIGAELDGARQRAHKADMDLALAQKDQKRTDDQLALVM